MKKYFIFLLMLILFPLTVQAKDEFSIKCHGGYYKEFEEFNCRTIINSDFEYNKITFDLDLNKNIMLEDVRSNFTSLWKVSINKNTVTAETKKEVLVSGLQEFSILLFKTLGYGKSSIKLKNINLINTSDNKTIKLDEVKEVIKVLSPENKLKNIYVDGKKIKKFNSNLYSYNFSIDSSVSKVDITADLIDKNAEITGIGEIEINKNNKVTVVPINIKSESGINLIYILYLVKDDIEFPNIEAESILLKADNNNIIDFNFNPNVYEYNIELNHKVKSVEIISKLSDNFSFVKGYGNRVVNVNYGDNAILIMIKDKEGKEITYLINVTKLLSDKSSNTYLKSLSVNNYDLKFNKRVKKYKLLIKKSVKNLDITAIPEDSRSNINIIGNENLTDGSVIKVVVKAENESKVAYNIEVSHKKTNILLIVVYLILVLTVIGIANEVFKKIKNKKHKIKSTKKQVKPVIKKQVSKKKENNKQSNSKLKTKKVEQKKTVVKSEVEKKIINNKPVSKSKVKQKATKENAIKKITKKKPNISKETIVQPKIKKDTIKKKSDLKPKTTKDKVVKETTNKKNNPPKKNDPKQQVIKKKTGTKKRNIPKKKKTNKK